MKITVKQLIAAGVHPEQSELCAAMWGDKSIEVNDQMLTAAEMLGIDISCLLRHILPSSVFLEYGYGIKRLWEVYKAELKPINDNYTTARKLFDDEYLKIFRMITDEYQTKRNQLKDAYIIKCRPLASKNRVKCRAVHNKYQVRRRQFLAQLLRRV